MQTLFAEVSAIAEPSDCQLIASFVQHQDEVAFEQLVHRHGPMVIEVCRRVVGDRHLAEDAFQATFVVLARKARSIRSPELLANWLYGVAYRTALKAKAKLLSRRQKETHVDMNQIHSNQSDKPVDEEEFLGVEELLGVLDQELSQLNDRFRTAIVLCDLQGRSRKEAADSLGISEGTLSSRLSRGREKLRGRLTRRGIVVGVAALGTVLCSAASASLSPVLVTSTTMTVMSTAVTGTATGTVISSSVASLSDAVIKAMFFAKLKVATAVVAAVCATVTVPVVTQQVIQAQQAPPQAVANIQQITKQPANTASPLFPGPGQTIGWNTVSTGRYPDANPPREWSAEKNVVWKTKMPGRSFASPVVLPDRIFVTSQPAELLCVQASDGKVTWQRSHTYHELFGEEKAKEIADAHAHVRELVEQRRPLINKVNGLRKTRPPSDKELQETLARSLALKERIQQATPPYPKIPSYSTLSNAGNAACTPVTDGKNVFSVFATGIVSSHTIDGKQRWMRFVEAPTTKYGHASSPVLVGDKLIVHLADLVALNANTGDEVWRVKRRSVHYSPLATRIGDVDVVLAAGGTIVRASDGRVLADELYRGSTVTPIIHGKIVYMHHSENLKAMRLPESAGETIEVENVWEDEPPMGDTIPTPTCHDGLIYSVTTQGILKVFDASAGQLVYQKRLTFVDERGRNGRVYPSPTLAGDFLYVSGNDGRTYVIATGREYKEVAVNELEPFTSTPVFINRRMYVRGEEHLYCIGN